MHSHRARVGRALIALFLLVQLFAVTALLAATPPADFSDVELGRSKLKPKDI